MQGSVAEAEQQLRKVVREHPRYPLGWYNLGNVVRDAGRLQEAVDSFRHAIRLDPAFADAHNGLGQALHRACRFDEAEEAYRRHLALHPDSVPGSINLASLLIDRGRLAEAIQWCREAGARTSSPAAMSDFQWLQGAALSHLGNLTAARAAFQGALASVPRHSRALWGMGLALLQGGKPWEGLQSLAQARALEPDSADFRGAMAGVYLATGNMRMGWHEYRERPARIASAEKFPNVKLAPGPIESLSAKSVLVLREQGLGDELFFLRYAPGLKSRGAILTYLAHPKIAPLLARVPALDGVIDDPARLPVVESAVLAGDLPVVSGLLDASPYRAAEAPIAALKVRFPSLPRVFYPDLPPPLPLLALPQKLTEMSERLSELGPPPYLGLTWRAGTAPEQQSAGWLLYKEIPLERLGAMLQGSGATLLALQRQARPGEIAALSAVAGKPVHDLTALNDDLEAMLALLSLVEEYVGVSNTNMHLRAGVRRSARVLVPRRAEWRWFFAGDESPWFPGFRVYRQGNDGGWDAALARLREDLLASWARRE